MSITALGEQFGISAWAVRQRLVQSDIPRRSCTRPPEELEVRFWRFVDKLGPDECWEWKGSKALGYGQLSRGPNMAPWKAHRLSWAFANGRMPERHEHVLHECDNPPCVNPAHLHLGDPAMNAKERKERGREAPPEVKARPGELNGCAKLTWAAVREIRSTNKDVSSAELARRYSVDPALIRRIRSGQSWKENGYAESK